MCHDAVGEHRNNAYKFILKIVENVGPTFSISLNNPTYFPVIHMHYFSSEKGLGKRKVLPHACFSLEGTAFPN